MVSERDLIIAIDELETLLSQSAALPSETSVEDRKEALALRRQIASQNMTIAKLGDAMFVETASNQRFRTEVGRLRSSVNSHLSCWPIATMDMDDVKYQESLARLRQAYRDFISWLRQELRSQSR